MKTLLLLRHAQSANALAGQSDFERSLNDFGRNEAKAAGRYLQKQILRLDLVLSSPALRARETTELVLESAGLSTEVRYDQKIYEGGPLGLLDVVSEIEAEKNTVLLVGHNPAIEELVRLLTYFAEHMSTGSLAKIDLNAAAWGKALDGKGSLDWIVRAKELS